MSAPHDPIDTVVVGRIGRPHGVRGDVTVEVRTDDPDLRFVPGAVLRTDPADRGPITITRVHWHGTTLLLGLEGGDGQPIDSREAAEAVRNTELLVDVADLPEIEDPDSFYDHQLVGLAARLPDGSALGEVTAVRHEAQDLLVVRRPGAPDALIPFVSAIVPTVDLAGGFVVVDPPEGLLEL
ncbi:ribosome maturation factor RimM [Blastococcus sp. CT_GayMR20]|uniref:ribosome maturation factor RimM n=1 Tax=Blastococcus sp. CT_GayMR20 TaxID=2559609 RepID=UPI001072F1E5|nr:ribosome maturation factor RimM [Blastococcus sp. CT_GayMR20]TFV81076.1 ribosome maturation factor RimM [Blastococcus sp. CT_GayMR20]TFV81097.1 ribosome maturation factor RimM [Blastococcus sp. CT_GayMR20]